MKRFSVLVILFSLVACTKKEATNEPLTPEQLAQNGKKVYEQYCTACHAADASKVGPVGPPIKGSSLELLQARVLTSGYPPNYKPQRDTKTMPTFSYLEKDIPALHAYLK